MPVAYEVIQDDYYQTLENADQPEISYALWGYKKSSCKKAVSVFLNTVFLGVPYVLCIWNSKFKAVLLYKKAPLKDATIVLLFDKNATSSFIEIKTENLKLPRRGDFKQRYFIYHYAKYIWMFERGEFGPFEDFLPTKTLEQVLNLPKGLFEKESDELIKLYGHNEITIEIKSYYKLFVEEILNPFYVFQIFSVILWSFDDYYVYAGCVMVLLLFSAIGSLHETRKQSMALYSVIKSGNESVEVLVQHVEADPTSIRKFPRDLVPGDVLLIPRVGLFMPCDAVLLTGMVLVNESSLTGESVPVTKTPPHVSDEIYNTNTHKRHTLFAGTEVVQARYYGGEYVLARVVRTGFETTKGSLVKSILFPSPVGLQFYEDSIKFIMMLGSLALIGVFYCLYLYISRGASIKFVLIRALDIFTILVPPALPAAMTVGMAYSQGRLKKKGIFCISPQRINICGKIKLACFDKTGTLTNEGLELNCVIPYGLGFKGTPLYRVSEMDPKCLFVQAMATCHSLTKIHNKMIGDPLDLTMFETLDWKLEEPGSAEVTRYDMLAPTTVRPRKHIFAGGDMAVSYELGIIQQFVFTSTHQCMSVIVRELGAPHMVAFTKGAPEKVIGMCTGGSIPGDFYTQLAHFTAQGYRMIALAFKNLPTKFRWKDAQLVPRDLIECDLTFLGFIIMKNALKPETTPVIEELQRANIRTVMITGDNAMTAVSVARDCKMIEYTQKVMLLKTVRVDDDASAVPKLTVEGIGEEINVNNIDFEAGYYHFAVDGKTWEDLLEYYPEILPSLLMRTTIFARFQPDQKTQLVNQFQALDYVVSMVGDGANDCGALKAAHVGVSLSQAEASVAAPFTSSRADISCIVELIKEGRCALVTSFATFKYMTLYSLIQFFSIIILYDHYSILGDLQFLFIDLIITTSLAVTIGRQGPPDKLVAQRPMGSLIAGKNIIPMFLQITLCGVIQYLALLYLSWQPWFEPLQPGLDEIVLCWENTVIFLISCYQYVVMACVYSKGPPYRQSIIANFWLLFCSLALICFITFLIVRPDFHMAKFFEVMPLSHDFLHHVFRYKLLVFPVIHLLGANIIEGLGDSKWFPRFVHLMTRKREPKNKYKRLANDFSFKHYFSGMGCDSNGSGQKPRSSAHPININKREKRTLKV